MVTTIVIVPDYWKVSKNKVRIGLKRIMLYISWFAAGFQYDIGAFSQYNINSKA